MLTTATQVKQFLMQHCHQLVADIAEERFAEQPCAGVNHPAWILGHLAVVAESMLGRLGVPKTLPAEWGKLFGPGSKPSALRSDYPLKAEFLKSVEERYQELRQQVANASAE
jgi:hypothetical protein